MIKHTEVIHISGFTNQTPKLWSDIFRQVADVCDIGFSVDNITDTGGKFDIMLTREGQLFTGNKKASK